MNEISKYMSDETVDEVIEKFETAVGIVFPAILPVVISGVVLLMLSIFEGIKNSSLIFGSLFFVCMIPFWILGVGAFSIGSALNKLIDSINFLLQTTVNISVTIYKDKKALGNGTVNTMTVCTYSFNNILLPILRTGVKRKFGGKIVLKLIESIMKRVLKPLSGIVENAVVFDNTFNGDAYQNDTSVIQKPELLIKGADRINTITKNAISGIRIVSISISVFFALAGILLTAILFAVHYFIKF